MSKPLWKLFLIGVGVVVLWRASVGAIALWQYTRLSAAVPAQVTHIEVVPNRSKYVLEAAYTYNFQEKTYFKKARIKGPDHLNRASAEKAADRLKEMQWLAYIHPTQPQKSALENPFPFREVLYGTCLVAIFLYFIYLHFHLEFLSRAQ